jgi:hypothetical protein
LRFKSSTAAPEGSGYFGRILRRQARPSKCLSHIREWLALLSHVEFTGGRRSQKQQKQHEYLYWEFHERGFKQAISMGDWKAVRLGTKQPIELYDLKHDAGETRNVADQYPDVVRKVAQLFSSERTDSPTGQFVNHNLERR